MKITQTCLAALAALALACASKPTPITVTGVSMQNAAGGSQVLTINRRPEPGE